MTLLLSAMCACESKDDTGVSIADEHRRDSTEVTVAATRILHGDSNPGKSDKNRLCRLEFLDRNSSANKFPELSNTSSSLFDRVKFFIDGAEIGSIGMGAENNPFVQDDFDNHFSPSCDLAWVGNLAFGTVEDDKGRAVKFHDRYYCAFVRLPDMCVVGNSTDLMCDGQFDSSGQWVRNDGEDSDIDLSYRVTAKGLLDGNLDGSGLVGSIGNLLRCDPVSKENSSLYSDLIKRNIIKMSAKERDDLAKRVDEFR
ncbi:hypothetical protein [Pseudoxanthomonas putridarboris]|uniref:hypothetical protein n=1 Tax=Pseudoxanthomonas putridarboris TaxID=752605 RepID=UPI00311F25A2